MESNPERYSHRFHAGNVGDVWKHVVWAALLDALTQQDTPLHVLETHAGEGAYALPSAGEWQAGVGRAAKAFAALDHDDDAPVALTSYFRALERCADATYPGSPWWTLKGLRPGDRASFCEMDPEAHAHLGENIGDDARAKIHLCDGIAALKALKSTRRKRVVFIDPPYSAKEDWTTLPRVMAEVYAAHPKACIALWYPIKSYTRPNAMLEALQRFGVPALALELVTTPLKLQRNRLNGSGMLLVNAPGKAVSRAMAAVHVLGAACATHNGHWAQRAHRVQA